MNWLAQVRHVMAKDLRHARWLIVGYAAAVGAATAHAITWSDATGRLHTVAMIALTLFAVLIVATLVQSDSPRSATAFWVTRPLAPSAVLAAKVGMIVFLLLLPSLGEAAGLAMLRVSAGRMVSLIGGGLVAFGAWLLVAALFAAVTTDLPAFILVYVAVPLGGLALLWMLASPSTAGGASTSDVQRNVATAVSVAAGLGLLALVFRRRDIGRGIWLPVLVVGPGLMVARAIGVRPALRPTAPDAFVAFHVTPSPQQVRGYLGIHAGPDSLGPDRRVQLTYDSIVVGLRDGKSVTVMGTGSYGNYGSGTPVGGSDWSWHGCHSFVWNSPTADQSIQLTATQSAIVADGGGIASIDLYGRAVESRARILTRAIPPGTWRNVAEGLRVRVAGVRSGPDDITARLETIDVPHDAVPLAPFPIAGGIYRFEVQFVNTERREVVDLGVRGAGSNFGWMVLPGVATNEGWVRLQCPWGTGRDSVPPDREWLRRANLSVVEWVPSGPYPVHASYRSPN